LAFLSATLDLTDDRVCSVAPQRPIWQCGKRTSRDAAITFWYLKCGGFAEAFYKQFSSIRGETN
jgi:hypothetical protein